MSGLVLTRKPGQSIVFQASAGEAELVLDSVERGRAEFFLLTNGRTVVDGETDRSGYILRRPVGGLILFGDGQYRVEISLEGVTCGSAQVRCCAGNSVRIFRTELLTGRIPAAGAAGKNGGSDDVE